jgi:colicin import membrane protein
MLCVQEVCYIGSGPGTPARKLARGTAFGPGIALGSRAGACNNTLGCVFRDIDLEAASALIQPIDLRIVRHDRREAAEARPDDSCTVSSGRLSCRGGVSSTTWRAWIVPEPTAERAGADVLQAAVTADLPVAAANVRGDR